MSQTVKKLRSAAWFGRADKNGFLYRSWMKTKESPTMSSKENRSSAFATLGQSSRRVTLIFAS